jgi:L-threonylcarbamoyladenylate synthase
MLFAGSFESVTDQMRTAAREQMAAGRLIGILTTDEEQTLFADLDVVVVPLGSQTDLAQIARTLFAALRELDALQVDVILARQFAPEGLGVSIADRLLRAAEGRIIPVV